MPESEFITAAISSSLDIYGYINVPQDPGIGAEPDFNMLERIGRIL